MAPTYHTKLRGACSANVFLLVFREVGPLTPSKTAPPAVGLGKRCSSRALTLAFSSERRVPDIPRHCRAMSLVAAHGDTRPRAGTVHWKGDGARMSRGASKLQHPGVQPDGPRLVCHRGLHFEMAPRGLHSLGGVIFGCARD